MKPQTPTHTTPEPGTAATGPTPGRESLPHSCGGCDQRWSGTRTAHCSVCHRTFTGVGGFDSHKPGQCLDPADLGMRPAAGRSYTAWGWPYGERTAVDQHQQQDR